MLNLVSQYKTEPLSNELPTEILIGSIFLAMQSLQSKRIVLFVILGLAAFILYLAFYVGTGNFIDVIRQANAVYFSASFIAFVAASFFSALTWRSFLSELKINISVRNAQMLTWAGYFFDATLPEPGWSGDISKSYMLSKKTNEEVGKIVASVVSQKIVSMAITIFILIVGFGLLALNVTLPQEVIVFFGAVMAISVLSFVVVYLMSTSFKATKAMLNFLLIPILGFFLRSRFNEERFRSDAEGFLSMFHKGIDVLGKNRKAFLQSVSLYLLSVFFDILIVSFVFASLAYSIPIDKVLIVYALTGTLASIGVAFVGLTEIIMSTAYQVLSVPLALSFSLTLLTRIVTLWFKFIIGYITFQFTGVGILAGKRKNTNAISEKESTSESGLSKP